MMRRNPDLTALAVLTLALWLGLPSGLARGEAHVGVPPVAIADVVDAEERIEQWLERFERRRDRVWERLEQRMHEFEGRLAEQEQRSRPGLRRAGRFAS
jgi:hypothetical protein